jgi:hypothetical protein
MEETRKLIDALTTAARMEGLPNRWPCTEISAYCDLQPEMVTKVARRRTGILIDGVPCLIEVEQEAECLWLNVDRLASWEMQA